jgi:hypothetical protein
MEEVSIDEMIPGKRYYIKGIYHPPDDEPDAPDMFKGARTQTGVFQEKQLWGTYGQGEYAKFSDIKDLDVINKKTGKPKFSIYNIESAFGSPTIRDTSKFQFFKKKQAKKSCHPPPFLQKLK